MSRTNKENFVEKIRRFRNRENMWWAWPLGRGFKVVIFCQTPNFLYHRNSWKIIESFNFVFSKFEFCYDLKLSLGTFENFRFFPLQKLQSYTMFYFWWNIPTFWLFFVIFGVNMVQCLKNDVRFVYFCNLRLRSRNKIKWI